MMRFNVKRKIVLTKRRKEEFEYKKYSIKKTLKSEKSRF